MEAKDVKKYAENFAENEGNIIVDECNKISMLHPETLTLLYYFGKNAKNYVLEIGAYIGGSSISICSGRQKNQTKVLSIEMGGAYLTHPHLPSSDILKDLKTNAKKFNVEDRIKIFEGHSGEHHIFNKIKDIVSKAGIDLLFIDADGDVERDIERYWNLLNNNCILILDDYYTSEAPEKQTLVQKWVNNAKVRAMVDEYCIVKWGTWIGRLDKTKTSI